MDRMTLFRPGQRPPQVTMPAQVFFGSKNNFSRGPANSNSNSSFCADAGSLTMFSGMRSVSLTECPMGDSNLASPKIVIFIALVGLNLLNEASVCGYPKIYGSGHLKNPEVVKGSLVLFIFVPW